MHNLFLDINHTNKHRINKKRACQFLSFVLFWIFTSIVEYREMSTKIWFAISSQILSRWMSCRGLKACLSIPVSPKYNALSQTTGRANKFNGLKEKQHMAVCRISFLCFVNKFPPESALTPHCCPGQRRLSKCSFSLPIFSICSQNRPPPLSEHCLVLILVLSSTYFCEFQISLFLRYSFVKYGDWQRYGCELVVIFRPPKVGTPKFSLYGSFTIKAHQWI